MRSLSLVLLVACGTVPGGGGGFPDPDAGIDASALDGGAEPIDAGPVFTCDAGAVFCSSAGIWSCTFTGRDAVLIDSCHRSYIHAGEMAAREEQGMCSLTRCAADAGAEFPSWTVYCCVP